MGIGISSEESQENDFSLTEVYRNPGKNVIGRWVESRQFSRRLVLRFG
jgi:hypothetical protein